MLRVKETKTTLAIAVIMIPAFASHTAALEMDIAVAERRSKHSVIDEVRLICPRTEVGDGIGCFLVFCSTKKKGCRNIVAIGRDRLGFEILRVSREQHQLEAALVLPLIGSEFKEDGDVSALGG